ncbi:tetratricopeptide repeat protein [Leptospira andrefontaineae]|uniref:Tetratricopeptide repeat protein n=1 Tax=Leptospira andrefontaineae TaxID=2484976 RepID=A0A4R9HAU4_9LEPT|nr:tetratricopeptide repeat protein [Leptospira andrefontaineae]
MDKKYKQGLDLFLLNKRQEALKVFREIYSEDPNYKEIRLLIGKLLYYDRKFKESETIFKEAFEEDETNWNALNWIIKSQFASRPLSKEIVDNLHLYLSKESENPEVLFISGRLLEESQKTDQAIATYERIVSHRFKLALAHERLAEIYEKAKLGKKAEFHKNQYKLLSGRDMDGTSEKSEKISRKH